jgi:hypothetical protein
MEEFHIPLQDSLYMRIMKGSAVKEEVDIDGAKVWRENPPIFVRLKPTA